MNRKEDREPDGGDEEMTDKDTEKDSDSDSDSDSDTEKDSDSDDEEYFRLTDEEIQQAQQFYEASIRLIRAELDHIYQLTLNEMHAQIAQPAVEGSPPIREALQNVHATFQKLQQDFQTSPIRLNERVLIHLTCEKTRRKPVFRELPLNARTLIRVLQAALERIIEMFREKHLSIIAQEAERRPEPIDKYLYDLYARIFDVYQAHKVAYALRSQHALRAHTEEDRYEQQAVTLESVAAHYGRMAQYARHHLRILATERAQQEHRNEDQEAEQIQDASSTIATDDLMHASHGQAPSTSMDAPSHASSGTSRPSQKRARVQVPDESDTAPPSPQRKK
ncbi:hypothetical protein B9Z55_023570 [Caenorhabditis nigoni]|uniref:Uncharacterized protein n=1 Tax=Caenorhabditis nigoni TaxID=1611254 RepID=A0A2G5SQR5_9PELO|nr:hypothetical protein B9Z55_023570 [Caenorhabditis nigoni]